MAEILILGAGMVGISTALAFQDAGHGVTLVDRGTPGQETSFGNAGVIQVEAAEPYAMPRDLGTLWRYALGQSNDVSWSLRGASSMAGALWSYYRNSAPARHRDIGRIYSQMTARATADHGPLITAAGAENLIARGGLSDLYRDARGYEAALIHAAQMQDRYGVTYRALDGAAARVDEPALRRDPAGVIHWDQSWTCSNPGALCTAYADLFTRRGGQLVRGEADTLTRQGAGWSVQTEAGEISAEAAVIALGPWSPGLLARFGHRVAMIYKRGYHGHYQTPIGLRRPFLDVSAGIVASSMAGGLRLTSGAQIVPMGARGDPRQLDLGRARIGEMLDIGAPLDNAPWFGTRPCLPDMLPMVGAVPGQDGLWVNFGHGHQGFTLGPTTAALLVQAYETGEGAALRGLSPSARL